MRKLKLEELGRVTPGVFSQMEKTPLVLILDNVRSALNVGSAFRTADAFALEKIYLCGITAKPPHREILKTALGATETIAWEYYQDTTKLIKQLQMDGWVVLAAEQAVGSIGLQEFQVQPGAKYSIVFGNEVDGVSESVMKLVNDCIEIPQYGTKHSLNIAVCIGIVVWDIFRQLNFKGSIPG